MSKSRSEQFLDALKAKDPSLLPQPITREDEFLRAIATGEPTSLNPVVEHERFLQAIAEIGAGSPSGNAGGISNLFDGKYIDEYYVSSGSTDVYYALGDEAKTAFIPIVANKKYLVGKSTSSRFRTMFLTKYPNLNGTVETIGADACIDHSRNTTAMLTAPSTATHLAIQVTNMMETVDLLVLDFADVIQNLT